VHERRARGRPVDGWGECFKNDAWQEAFRAEGIDPERIAYGDWEPSARLPWDVVDSRVNKKWLALDLKRALKDGTLAVCGPKECHGCAPFARDCVKGIVSVTTGRPLDAGLPILSTPSAPGPGIAARAEDAPVLVPRSEGAAPPAPAPDVPRYRYRARFTKEGRLRFLGHLDLTRTLLRAMRRARVRFVYSQGFNPKPKVAFGPALSVGVSSEGEYVDFETLARLDPEPAIGEINAALPAGIRFVTMCGDPQGRPQLI
jgi:hypothetical protein